MIKTGKPVIDFDDTFAILKILIAYNLSKNEKRKVHLNDIYV